MVADIGHLALSLSLTRQCDSATKHTTVQHNAAHDSATEFTVALCSVLSLCRVQRFVAFAAFCRTVASCRTVGGEIATVRDVLYQPPYCLYVCMQNKSKSR